MRQHESSMPVDALVFTPVAAAAAQAPQLRAQLLDTWVRVTDAGGAVGFVPPADPRAIGVTLDSALARVAGDQDALGVLRRGDSEGEAVGMGILSASASPLRNHWRTVLRLMVAPACRATAPDGCWSRGCTRWPASWHSSSSA